MSTPEEITAEVKAKTSTSGVKSFLSGAVGGVSCVLVGTCCIQHLQHFAHESTHEVHVEFVSHSAPTIGIQRVI